MTNETTDGGKLPDNARETRDGACETRSDTTRTRTCLNCGSKTPYAHNYCDFVCHIDAVLKDGGTIHLPNNLPISCITAKGELLEHGHGNHPDYKFPVDIEYIGPITSEYRDDYKLIFDRDPSDDDVRKHLGERHALIYTDGFVVLTIYECYYDIWHLQSGDCLSGGKQSHDWKLSDESIKKICEYGLSLETNENL